MGFLVVVPIQNECDMVVNKINLISKKPAGRFEGDRSQNGKRTVQIQRWL